MVKRTPAALPPPPSTGRDNPADDHQPGGDRLSLFDANAVYSTSATWAFGDPGAGVGVAAAAGYLLGPVVDAISPRTAFVLVGCLADIGTLATERVRLAIERGINGQ